MDVLSALLVELIVIAVLFELARRIGLPYPVLFVVGGLVLGFVPGLPRIALQPDLVLLVFLPPLLFSAAFAMPLRELRRNLWPIGRLAVGLVLVTMLVVGVVVQAIIPGIGWAAAFTVGAIVAPTDALAATSVFRRLGVPRLAVTLVEGEALFNDGVALIAYRTAVLAAVGGGFVLANAVGDFAISAAGGILFGFGVGWAASRVLRWLDDPPVEVIISRLVPCLAYLPADQLGLSAVLSVITAGLVIGRRLGTVLTASSRLLWMTTWKMVGFVLNGFAFILIGLELPDVLRGVGDPPPLDVALLAVAVCACVIATRMAWVFAASLLPGSPRRAIARQNRSLSWRLAFLVSWSGLRGAVSLAAALALPTTFPHRNLILLVTFAVIVVTLVGQGLTLPYVVRWLRWDGIEADGDEASVARGTMYQVGLDAVAHARKRWPGHAPLLDRLESGLRDRDQHLATENVEETAGRTQEHREHEAIQLGVINAQRAAMIELRDAGQINDETLRAIERELDLEELRMEA